MNPKPLAAIRVLEFGGYISGPYATSILCALGADVVKVERLGDGDEFRHQVDNRSPYFVQYNAGKRSIAVDLKSSAGIECIKALIPRFDVVIENMRPRKMDALGLSEPVCRALREDLIYLSLTGFGEGGPLASQASYDTIAQSFGGLYTLLADEGAPQLTGAIFADLITGLSTATGILAALVSRGTLHAGHHVRTSLVEAVSTITVDSMTQYYAEAHQNPSRQSRHPFAQNYCARTSSGEFIAMHCSSSQKFWRNLATAVGHPELADDERFATYAARRAHYHELVPIIEKEVATRSYAHWSRVFAEFDVPFAPVQTMDDFVHHPQIEWLQLLEPERGGLSLLRAPWRFDGARPHRSEGAPRVGEHTREVVGEVYPADRIEELVSEGVLAMGDQSDRR